MSLQSQQTGAPNPENTEIEDVDMWQFLGTPPTSDKPIRDVLRELSVQTAAIDFQCCPNGGLVDLFRSAVGYIGTSTHTNPFIRMCLPIDEFCTAHSLGSKDTLTRQDCENILREIAIAKFDPVTAIIVLLRVANTQMINGLKRIIVATYENNQEKWNVWKRFTGIDPAQMSEEKKRNAKDCFCAFWATAEKLFGDCISFVKELGLTEESVDFEKLLRSWRDIPAYFKESSWDSVLDRERVTFTASTVLSSNIEWSVRYKLLMRLLNSHEMGLSEQIIDIKLIEFESANSYETWIAIARSIFKLATAKGLSYRGNQQKKKQEPVPEKVKSVPLKVEGSRKWCDFHKSYSHSTEECRSQRQDNRPQRQDKAFAAPNGPAKPQTATSNCFICGDGGHWANKCPKRKQDTGTVPVKTTIQDRSVGGAVPPANGKMDPPVATSRFGRPLKPTKPFSLNTQATHDPFSHEEFDESQQDTLEIRDSPIGDSVCNHIIPKENTCDLRNGVLMPSVQVLVEDVQNCPRLIGLIDTGSNISYVSRNAFSRIQSLSQNRFPESKISESFQVETMNGSRSQQKFIGTQMVLAIIDSTGECSGYRTMNMIIHESEKIPGGFDFLLSADWVIDQRLGIEGNEGGYEIRLPRSKLIDASLDTSETSNIVLHSIQFDAPEIVDDLDDFDETVDELVSIIDALPDKAIQSGPLSESELRSIRSQIHDPALKLVFNETKMDPPVKEFGFPAPLERQQKLFTLLETLEAQNIVRQVPRGTGRYVSPGYAVKKSGDRVRLVVKYCSLNDRLQAPAGVRHHSPVEWMHQLPSWGKFFSVLDVKDAFYRIDVDEASRSFLNMSIWSPAGPREYEWLKMPQGLFPSPSYWCALIESTISSLIRFLESHPKYRSLLFDNRILVYVDDVLITSRNKESCELLTNIVYQILSYSKMYLPESKIQRCQEEVEIMGLRLHNGCISPNATTIEKMKNLRKPRDKSELLAALGLLNYVRRSLPTQADPASTKIGCLYELSRGKGFHWNSQHDDAWTELVIRFNEGLPIACFSLDPLVENCDEWTLIIQCDASTEYLGFVTMIVPKLPDSLLADLSKLDVSQYKEQMNIINVGSKRLQHSERLYVPHDREAYGIFWALQSNRALIYLFGEVILQTDNKTALSRYSKLPIEDASTTRGRRWIRWISDLSDLIFSRSKRGRVGMIRFCHVNGPMNCFADYLSRYVFHDMKICEIGVQTDVETSSTICLSTSISATSPTIGNFEHVLMGWDMDRNSEYIKKIKFHEIHSFLSGSELNASPVRLKVIEQVCVRRFSLLPNGCLQFHNNSNPVVVVPDVPYNQGPLRIELIRLYHEGTALSCHRGETGTRACIRRTFWWPRMDQDIARWIASCIPCVSRKGQCFSGTFNPRKLQAPNQLLLCDWSGPHQPSVAGYQYILVMVDAYSSYSIALPYRHKLSENTADGLLHWISLFGCPDRWSSDNDSTFVSETICNLRNLLGIREEFSPSYSPSTQGGVERVVGVIKQGIEVTISACDDADSIIDWPSLIKACVFNSNCIERHGGISPFEVMLGRKPVDPFMSTFGFVESRTDSGSYDEYVIKLKDKLKVIHDYWSSKSMEVKNRAADLECSGHFDCLEPHDLCVRVSYISGRRMNHGTVRVNAKIGTNTYSVYDENGNLITCHGYQLIKIFDHPNRHTYQSTTMTNTHDADDGEYFEIEKILDFDPEKGYLVKWKDYPPSFNSWQKASDMPIVFRKEMAKIRRRNLR